MTGLVDVVAMSRSSQWRCWCLAERRRRCSRFWFSQLAR